VVFYIGVLAQKVERWATWLRKIFDDIRRLDAMQECNRQTDGHTLAGG